MRIAFGVAVAAALFLFARRGGDEHVIAADAFDFEDDINMYTKDELLAGLLYAIKSSEHVWPRDVDSGDAYRLFYGRSRFDDLSDHPVITGEKRAVPLPPDMCRNAGFANGKCFSTAAGAYQLIKPTWERLRAKRPYLLDFSPASQDEAARRLLEEIGALDALYSGDIAQAIAIAAKHWASLPGSPARQRTKSMDYVLARFNEGANGVA